MGGMLTLRAVLGRHDRVKPLRDGTIVSDRLRLDLVEIDPLPKAFRRMVRSLDFDLCEMALTTQALAYRFEKPIGALPIPLWRRFHHGNLVCAAGSGIRGPADLAGQRVGVRAYSQTTGVWIRGILETDHGLDPGGVTWVTLEDAHVAEYADPPNVVRAAPGRTLRDMLLAGEIAAIMGERNVDPANVRPVIPDPDAAAAAWHARTGLYPVNHVVAVKAELLAAHPWLGPELMDLFARAAAASGTAPVMIDGRAVPDEDGLEPNRRPMQTLLDFAARQGLTPRAYSVDELFVAP